MSFSKGENNLSKEYTEDMIKCALLTEVVYRSGTTGTVHSSNTLVGSCRVLSGVHLLPPMMLADIVQMSQSAVLERFSREHVVFRTLLDLASKVNKLLFGFNGFLPALYTYINISGAGD